MGSFAPHRHPAAHDEPNPETRGLVMDWGRRYDLFVAVADVLLRGKLRQLRERALHLAELQPGEAVLDVGCGTGTLAVFAQERVSPTGRVAGIDPGPRQIARARAKASRRGMSVDFQVGVIEQLPFPEGSFDVVFSTLMMHHLPDDIKRQGLAEIVRVLKSGGRLVIIDFAHGTGRRSGARHMGAGSLGLEEQPALLMEAGFSLVESGKLPFPRLPGIAGAGFARGRRA